MRTLIRRLLCLALLLGTFALALPLYAAIDGPHRGTGSWLARDGGDVLRPARSSSGGPYHWYLGIDAGLTWSTFQNGPLAYYTSNPHNPRYVLESAVEEGSGLGFALGLTADFPLSKQIGLLLKAQYHTRAGSFDMATDLGEIHPDTQTDLTTILQNKTDWTFTYLSFDVLLRVDLGSSGLYLMAGPSFASLSENSAKLDQTIVQPDDIYYVEDIGGVDDIVNNLRSASSTEEVAGIMSSRLDLKAGLGWRFDLNEKLQLVPEVTLAYPLSKLVDEDHEIDGTDPASVYDWTGSFSQPIVTTNTDFNMMTVFFTLGLRWRIGS